MLAANIGAGSTVGAAGLAYRDGISAWWWVGSAGLASIVFAMIVAPKLWRLAKAHNFYTTGDYLEFRYGPSVRLVVAIIICLGSLALLAGQLIAGAAILNVVVGVPRWAGALIGAGVMTIYFSAGGLLGSAWVNTAAAHRHARRLSDRPAVCAGERRRTWHVDAQRGRAAMVRRFLLFGGTSVGLDVPDAHRTFVHHFPRADPEGVRGEVRERGREPASA